jgi:gliding motility-associated-like protein
VDPSSDSFSFTLYGNSPAAMGLNPYSLEDSICRLKDDHFYRVQSFGSPLFFGVTQGPSELDYTKLGRWTGSAWNKISMSQYSPILPVPNLALNALAAGRMEYVALAQERPYVDAGKEVYLYMTESEQLVPTGYFPINSVFSWDPVEHLDDHQIQDPVFTMGKPGKYTLKVSNGVGCEASDDVFIHILIPPLFMPNAFTPNNDNRNEGFGPVLGPGDTLENMIIYNRWGVKIFEGNSNWDGRYMNEMCPNDAYVYEMVILRTADVHNFRKVLKGTVTLMR